MYFYKNQAFETRESLITALNEEKPTTAEVKCLTNILDKWEKGNVCFSCGRSYSDLPKHLEKNVCSGSCPNERFLRTIVSNHTMGLVYLPPDWYEILAYISGLWEIPQERQERVAPPRPSIAEPAVRTRSRGVDFRDVESAAPAAPSPRKDARKGGRVTASILQEARERLLREREREAKLEQEVEHLRCLVEGEELESKEYEVESILDHEVRVNASTRRPDVFYLVKWLAKGEESWEPSWEPSSCLLNAPQMVAQYHQRLELHSKKYKK
jgi:hypothetical protein